MFVICCVSFFVRGLPHKKGVCIIDIFCRINHFDSKWRVKYSVLFVVGAASLRPSRCKQNSRNCFSAPFWSFLHFFAKNVYEPNFAFYW